MCRLTKVLILASVVVAFLALPAQAQWRGNGLPKNQKLLFNLEIIAYDSDHCPQSDPNGHRIAVKADFNPAHPNGISASSLVRDNDILLMQGDFAVLDGNACTDGEAKFQLPADPFTCPATDPLCLNTDPDFQVYEVWLRLVGRLGTKIDVATCAIDTMGTPTDTTDDIVRCSTEEVEVTRTRRTKFANVSKKLLTLCLDTDGSGGCDTRVALFDPNFSGFFWDWGTDGKAHAQLFFLAVPD